MWGAGVLAVITGGYFFAPTVKGWFSGKPSESTKPKRTKPKPDHTDHRSSQPSKPREVKSDPNAWSGWEIFVMCGAFLSIVGFIAWYFFAFAKKGDAEDENADEEFNGEAYSEE